MIGFGGSAGATASNDGLATPQIIAFERDDAQIRALFEGSRGAICGPGSECARRIRAAVGNLGPRPIAMRRVAHEARVFRLLARLAEEDIDELISRIRTHAGQYYR